MTKGYVCVECGSQIVGHSKADCDAGRAELLFENWWNEGGRFLDPDIAEVSWFDKRKELAGLAYIAGRMSAPKWTPFVGQPVPQPERDHSGNGVQFEYCWIRAKKNSGSVQAAIELVGEDGVKDLAAIWWRYGIQYERGKLLLNPDGTDYED